MKALLFSIFITSITLFTAQSQITSKNHPEAKKIAKPKKITSNLRQPNTDSLVYDTVLLNNYPTYKGNLFQVQKKLEADFKKWLPIEVLDSALVFSGLVNEQGKLENVKLIFGRESTFSNNMIKFIERELTSWWPAYQNRPVRHLTKFFVKLENDSSLTFMIKDSY